MYEKEQYMTDEKEKRRRTMTKIVAHAQMSFVWYERRH